MSSLRPVSLYGLSVPPDDEPTLAFEDFPATVRITMAAIDPFEKTANLNSANAEPDFKGATLRLIRIAMPEDDDDESDEDDPALAALLDDEDNEDEDDDDEDDDEQDEGGKSKAEKMSLLRELIQKSNGDMDEDEDEPSGAGKIISKKAAKVNGIVAKEAEDEDEDEDEDMEESDDDDEDDLPDDAEIYVLCSLEPGKVHSRLPSHCSLTFQNNQQPLDITINAHETVLFTVSGTHTVYLTGNIVYDEGSPAFDDEEDDEYDLSPDEDELEADLMHEALDRLDERDELDELDDLDDLEEPTARSRVTELSDDDGAGIPNLIERKAGAKKGKNKRPAEDEELDGEDDHDDSLDALISKSLKKDAGATPAKTADTSDVPKDSDGKPVGPDGQPLSKKQLKKLKKKLKTNAGDAVAPSITGQQEDTGKPEASPTPKKVSFAKELVRGPSSKAAPSEAQQTNGTSKALGTKTVQGVVMDDRKLGTGPAAKSGDKVSMRYIGKLDSTKQVFDGEKRSNISKEANPPSEQERQAVHVHSR